MITEIKKLLAAKPFEPFYVLTSGGNRYLVATADHADSNPAGSRIVIWFDDDSSITVAGLHIVAVETEASRPSQIV